MEELWSCRQNLLKFGYGLVSELYSVLGFPDMGGRFSCIACLAGVHDFLSGCFMQLVSSIKMNLPYNNYCLFKFLVSLHHSYPSHSNCGHCSAHDVCYCRPLEPVQLCCLSPQYIWQGWLPATHSSTTSTTCRGACGDYVPPNWAIVGQRGDLTNLNVNKPL